MSSRGYPITRQIRETRKKLADERQAEYDKLSLKEKLERLPPEPAAERQRARLLSLLNKPMAKTPEVEVTPIVQVPSAGQKGQAKRWQKVIDASTSGESKPKSPREFTDKAANEARNESNKGSK